MPNDLGSVLIVLVILASLGAAVFDILYFRIPNWLVSVVAALAVVKSMYFGIDVLAWSSLHALLALLAGMALFQLGWIGGGDAKFYAALAWAVPWEGALAMLGWSSIGGLLLLLFVAIARRMAGEPLLSRESSRWSVPYGVAIFIGGTAVLAQQPIIL